MTNFNIIANAAINNKIFTKDEIETMIENGCEIPLHTYQEWKKRGFQVKRGEHAKMKEKIWIFTRKLEAIPMKDGTAIEEEATSYYMKLSSFFTREQVEPIKA